MGGGVGAGVVVVGVSSLGIGWLCGWCKMGVELCVCLFVQAG